MTYKVNDYNRIGCHFEGPGGIRAPGERVTRVYNVYRRKAMIDPYFQSSEWFTDPKNPWYIKKPEYNGGGGYRTSATDAKPEGSG